MILEHNSIKYESGQDIIFKINGITLTGKLYIHHANEYYACHNNSAFNGTQSPELLGFNHSWVFHKQSDGRLSDDVEIISPILGNKENFKIDDKLKGFLTMIGKSEISNLLNCGDFLPQYNEFEASGIKGMVKIKNSESGRFVEMKIGRLLNTISKTFDFYKLTDKDVESIHNSYVMFQQDDYLNTIRDVKGKDILKYYTKSNYFFENTGGRLYNSCMNDRHDFLEIYVNNKAVSLIAIEQLGKVVGRCLIWELTDGRKMMDRRYTSFDWVDCIFEKIREDEDYINFDTREFLEIKLETSEFEKYPYVDTFRFLCKETNTLFNNYKSDKYKYIMDRTGGDIGTR